MEDLSIERLRYLRDIAIAHEGGMDDELAQGVAAALSELIAMREAIASDPCWCNCADGTIAAEAPTKETK